ncbi:hypothetical protein HDU96_002824 [Phlyctochytrium bullatum]|nr:hypothetical protein HDU96_002824 [Phlyctochytrium bullatum]
MLPPEVLLEILGSLHPNDIPVLSSVNRHLRRTIPAILNYNTAKQGLRIANLSNDDGTGTKAYLAKLRRIHFNHPAMFMHSAAVIGIYGITNNIADTLWGKNWDRHETDSKSEALREDRVRMMKLALNNGTFPNRQSPDFLLPAFRIAARLQSMELLDVLRRKFLKNNCEDIATHPMRTFFVSSAVVGFADGLSLIPNNDGVFGLNVARNGMTLMHLAIASKKADAVRVLLKKGALAPSTVSSNQHKFGSPLHVAASTSTPEILRLLLKNGADLEATDRSLGTALHKAVKGGHLQSARVLLEMGAAVNPINRTGDAPLRIAADRGRCDLITLILDAGANVDALNRAGETALFQACRKGRVDAVELLIKRGARTDVVGGNGTALHVAIRECGMNLRILKLLIDTGAPLDRPESSGLTPLHCALEEKKEEAAKILLTAGANPNVRDDEGRTPLHIAAEKQWRRKAVVQLLTLLVEKGADLNATDARGNTALHLAAMKREHMLLCLLTRTEIDRNARDGRGKTWLDVAPARSMKKWLEQNQAILTSAGVVISKPDRRQN